MNLRIILLVLVLGYFGWQELTRPPVTVELASDKGYTVTELEDFSKTIRVLSTEAYSSGREADLSPIDIAAGWGPVTDPAIYQQFEISQGGRWYRWTADHFPISQREFETHSSNIHIVPANAEIAAQLKKLKRDDLIEIAGALIEVQGADGWKWRSSLSREDVGAGACELLLLKGLRYVN